MHRAGLPVLLLLSLLAGLGACDPARAPTAGPAASPAAPGRLADRPTPVTTPAASPATTRSSPAAPSSPATSSPRTGPAAGEVLPPPDPAAIAQTVRFLHESRPRYQQAIRRARGWLDTLRLDPQELRRHGIKGKKKLVEGVDAYLRLLLVAPSTEQAGLRARIQELAAVTRRPGYHDLASLTEDELKQDSTSYLRLAYLLERAGMKVPGYREEIRRIQPRLDAQMKRRGPHQRMAFHTYYTFFGLTEPFPLAAGFQGGVIANRKDPATFQTLLETYDLTHEVFVPYEFGEKLDADFFTPADRAYLRRTLPVLTRRHLAQGDLDVVCELVSCLRYLELTDLPEYRQALAAILDAQRPEGKWGDYERYRFRFGDLVDQGFYLHTTMVAIDALTAAYDFPPRPGGAAVRGDAGRGAE